MPKYLLIAFFLILRFTSTSQPILITNNTISKPLAQLVKAYSTGFAELRGELVELGTETNGYGCLVKIAGAEPGVISGFGYGKDSVFTWSDNLFTSESFEKAIRQFKKIYAEVKGTKINIGNQNISLKADYSEPSESVGFASISFEPEPKINDINNLVVDLSIQYTNAEWKISLSIYNNNKDK